MENTGKNNILIVDDEPLNIRILRDILSPEYKFYIATNGASALDITDKYMPDLILLDIVMPKISGFDVLEKLKSSEKTKGIPVIIITGLESVEDEEKGLALDAADFIHKPFSVNIVKSRVRNQIQIINQIRVIKQGAKDLEAAVEAAETANRTKSAFLAKMSHEIRTPLNAILGISEIQMQNENDHKDPKEIKEAFTRIFNSGDLLLGIINDILDMSKIEAGKLELIQARYDVASLISDTVFLNMIKYENKPVNFTLKVDENVPSELFGDELRIKQILNNLLSNAFKYTASGEVELLVDAEYSAAGNSTADPSATENSSDAVTLVFRVRDTGQGMTAEQIGKLFDEYSRFNLEANRTTEGTGLGMSITQNLIRMMNGEIQAESKPGSGSLFTVRLPQGNTGAPALGKGVTEKLKQFRSGYEAKMKKTRIIREAIPDGRVLVVDDMDMNLYVARGMLAPYGLNIDTALSGYEAIEKIKRNEYDIVFMDHMMPKMDGIEAAREIRKLGTQYKKLPIIALTANAVSGMREVFLSNGFNGFISKPIVMQELDDIIKEFMPPEKITRRAKPETIDTDKTYDGFLDDAGKIDEINTETGLEQLSGDKSMYYSTLEIFCKKLISECDNMAASLESKDINSFTISVHAMKSMLAVIGAADLSRAAFDLETASKKSDIDFCTRQFPELKEKLLSLQKKLSVIFSSAREEKEPVDTRNLRGDTEKAPAVPAEAPLKFKTGKVLVVDDMEMHLFVIKQKLVKYGLEVDTATSGSEAIEKIKQGAYNLVFMDQLMPEMDGIETTMEIRKLGKEYEKLPVIALAANTDPGVKEMFLANGFSDFLLKPVVKQKLEEVLKEWLPAEQTVE
jgi:CheY-like chemotaxis protein/HPt (histidine-containing phosphotransfer) domain-containing protein